MVWNYQILKHKAADKNGNEDFYAVHELYRDKAGKIVACTEGDGALPSEHPSDVIRALRMMLKDCEHYSVYDYEKVPEDGAEDLGGDEKQAG